MPDPAGPSDGEPTVPCRECGHLLPVSVSRCPICGLRFPLSRFDHSSAASVPTARQKTHSDPDADDVVFINPVPEGPRRPPARTTFLCVPSKKRWRRAYVVAGLVAVLAVIAGVLVWFWPDSPDPTEPSPPAAERTEEAQPVPGPPVKPPRPPDDFQ